MNTGFFDCQVFLLHKTWVDKSNSTQLRFWGHASQLGTVCLDFDFHPMAFIRHNDNPIITEFILERKSSDLYNFNQERMDIVYFKNQKALNKCVHFLKQFNCTLFESDLDPCHRFLMERRIYASCRIFGKAVKYGNYFHFKNPKIKADNFLPQLSTLSLDIECAVKSGLFYSVAIDFRSANQHQQEVLMLGEPCDSSTGIHFFVNEYDLLKTLLQKIQSLDPDLIMGWNLVAFDMQFLWKKALALKIPFSLGRDGSLPKLYSASFGQNSMEIVGRIVMDLPASLRASFYKFPDYKLNTVAKILLGKEKLIDEANKIESIDNYFQENKNKLAEYNLEDANLVSEIVDKTELIDLAMKRSQLSGMFMQEIGRSVASFEFSYLPLLHRKKRIAGNLQVEINPNASIGAHVLEAQAGLHSDVFVLDFKSLYPSIIQTFKIDPLALWEKKVNTFRNPYGTEFSRTEHILPEIIERLMAERELAKKKSDKNLSMAIKILMNSFYGVMGSPICRFYHPELASSITGIGRFLLLETKKEIERGAFQVIYGDTDSLFIRFNEDKTLNKILKAKQLAMTLNCYWQKRLMAEYQIPSYLQLQVDKFYKILFLPKRRHEETAAKKRYAGIVLNGENTELLFTGLEAVRSDWTELAKRFQTELYERIFYSRDVDEFIRNFIAELRAGQLNNLCIYRKRIRKEINKYTKNIPPHIKAAIHSQKKAISEIRYIQTVRGPQAIDSVSAPIDYRHYLIKQLAPIADSILPFIGKHFSQFTDSQESLL